jgi:glucose/arabinose dehydrogenase
MHTDQHPAAGARTRGLTFLAVLLTGASCLAQTHIGGPGGVTELFNKTCAGCHSNDGAGGPMGTPTLLTDELFDQKHDRPFFDAIKNGKAGTEMEAFGASLSDKQIWSLVVHIRELQHAERRERLGSPTPKDKARDPQRVFATQRRHFRIEPLAGHTGDTKLDTPWAIEFFPPGTTGPLAGAALITEKEGSLRILKDGKLLAPVQDFPAGGVEVYTRGQAGLLDVAFHPDFASTEKDKGGWVYVTFTPSYPAGEGQTRATTGTKLVRGRLAPVEGKEGAWKWTDEQTVFEPRPDTRLAGPGVHFGSRIAFDPPIGGKARKGHVYFSIGEHGSGPHAQDLTRHNGKVHRLNDDGTIPADNPFVAKAKDNPKVYASIFSYGHRNPQGLVFDAKGQLWDTEHGPRGGDELNLVEAGTNYGWPLIAHSINYNDAPYELPWPELSEKTRGMDLRTPVLRWLPSLAVCGLAGGAEFVSNHPEPGADANGWGPVDLFAGGLAMNTVNRVRIKDGQPVEIEEVLYGIGRVRDVQWGPPPAKGQARDLVVVLNKPDRVVRLVAAPKK